MFIVSLATEECSECLTWRCLWCSFARPAIMCSICPMHEVIQTCRVSSPRLSLLSFKLLHVFRSMETDLILCCARIMLIHIHKAHCRFMLWYFPLIRSQDSVVGRATSYGLDSQGFGVRVPVRWRIFPSPNRPDRLWGPPNLLSNGYGGGRGKAAGTWSWPFTFRDNFTFFTFTSPWLLGLFSEWNALLIWLEGYLL
jgi:hypothetical protein